MRPRTSLLAVAALVAVLMAWVALGTGGERLLGAGPTGDNVDAAGAVPKVVHHDGRTAGGERGRTSRLPLVLLVATVAAVHSLVVRYRRSPGASVTPAGQISRWPRAGRAPPLPA